MQRFSCIVSSLTVLLVVVQLRFSIGSPVNDDGPIPMPDFQVEKSYGLWYIKLSSGKGGGIKCGSVEATKIDDNSFQSVIKVVLRNDTELNGTVINVLKSPGVYTAQREGKEPVTVTIIDTDYETYSVYSAYKTKDRQLITIVGRSPADPLPEETVDKIKKLLEDQKIDISGLTATDDTATC